MSGIITFMLAVVLWTFSSAALIWLPSWWLWNTFIVPGFGLPALSFIHCTGSLLFFHLARKGALKFEVKLR